VRKESGIVQRAKWYQGSYRRNLVDMHIEDWDEKFLSLLDPETYVGLLKKAQVQSAMVYANSHIGYCYWPTKTGQMHRGLGGKDVFGQITSLCHKEGMDVIAYYTLVYNNWAYARDPSWRIIDVKGRGSRERSGRGGRYGVCCPNSLGHREFVERQLRELCSSYDFDGIFLDMTFWPAVCYCSWCKERFAKEVGGEMPTVIDWRDARWRAFQKKREEWLVEFAAFATGTVKSCKPDVTVEHQSSIYILNWVSGATLGLTEHNDYLSGDFYGGFGQQSFICKLYDSITPNKPFEFHTSRCYPALLDHTTLKSKEMLELHTYLSLAHNAAFLFIDAIDPVGTLNPKVYETMGQIFGKSKAYEPYLGGSMCQDVGVYFSLESKMDFADNGRPVDAAWGGVPHLDAALGAARTLRESHIPFGVISKNNLKDTSAYQVIVLPNVQMLSGEEVEGIERFVASGGSLYVSGGACAGVLGELLGITVEGETAEWMTYMTPTAKGRTLVMPDVDPDYPLALFQRQAKARASSGEEVLATLTLPYTDPGDGEKMASIHSDPPGVSTDYAAVVYRPYGKGRVMWVSASLETAEPALHRGVFAQMVRQLASQPFSFEAEAPRAVEVTLFHQAERKRYLVNVVNAQEQLPPIPVFNARVRVRVGDKKVASVALLQEEKPLSFTVKGEYVEVVVPELDIFQMMMVEYE
jgi:Hypothetical glycosyl hydrolase 6/Beta-galactosidase trimerisation domain